MKAFKLVRREIGFLVSAMTSGRWEKVYDPGVWTYLPSQVIDAGYGLCVFTNESDARDFGVGANQELWECEVGGVFVGLPIFGLAYLELNLEDGTRSPLHTNRLDWPRGTVMVERVKLTRRIA